MGDFNAEPQSLTYKEIIKEGFRSSYFEANKSEPKITFPTGLQAPHMDTDPPLAVDFIFYRVGITAKGDIEKHIKIVKSQRMGEMKAPTDPTLCGSDHFSILSDFVIHPLK